MVAVRDILEARSKDVLATRAVRCSQGSTCTVPNCRKSSSNDNAFDIESRRVTELRSASAKGFLTVFAVSPDGAQVAYVVADEALQVMPATGGESRELSRQPVGGSTINALAWTPDQHYVLVGMGDRGGGALWRFPVTGGQPEKLISMGTIKSPHVHPDGRRLAFGSTESSTAEIWALENFLPAAAVTR